MISYIFKGIKKSFIRKIKPEICVIYFLKFNLRNLFNLIHNSNLEKKKFRCLHRTWDINKLWNQY